MRICLLLSMGSAGTAIQAPGCQERETHQDGCCPVPGTPPGIHFGAPGGTRKSGGVRGFSGKIRDSCDPCGAGRKYHVPRARPTGGLSHYQSAGGPAESCELCGKSRRSHDPDGWRFRGACGTESREQGRMGRQQQAGKPGGCCPPRNLFPWVCVQRESLSGTLWMDKPLWPARCERDYCGTGAFTGNIRGRGAKGCETAFRSSFHG